MRWKPAPVSPAPKQYDRCRKKIFLWLPVTLYIESTGEMETRWRESATIEKMYFVDLGWFPMYWIDLLQRIADAIRAPE